ncbi:MAG: non-heme iron oxygenase ferredoxin subunit [Candidatus Methanosuratus sp.]|nr:non-heme iron oxygenase ferredoxin subunit [Candidatus Methanosuratincola sp.]
MAFRVASLSEVPPGSMRSFTVSGKEILVANLNGRLYAMDSRCSHRNGDLSKGTLDGTVVTCPLHGSKFDLATGKSISGPKLGQIKMKISDLKSYPVKVDEGSIMVDVPE